MSARARSRTRSAGFSSGRPRRGACSAGNAEELTKLGYRCLYRSADAANYVRRDERVDFLYARRPLARRLLEQAAELDTSLGRLRVISPEGLIGFKLQGLVNDPRRTQEEGGIPGPPSEPADPYAALDELMAVVESLCPRWPERSLFSAMPDMRL